MGIMVNVRRSLLLAVAVSGLALLFLALAGPAAQPAEADDDDDLVCYAVNQQDQLLRFKCDEPRNIQKRTPIQGLGGTEDVVGIDFRISNFLLYAVIRDTASTNFRIATLDKATGTTTTTCTNGPLVGTSSNSFGVDFNPVVDRLRIVSDQNQNLRANPDAAGCGTITDGPLTYRPGDRNQGRNADVTAAGYTNSFKPSPRTPPPGTQLYDIDVRQDVLAEQVDPNGGLLATVGRLDVKVEMPSGFDIPCDEDEGLAALQRTGENFSRLYEVDLDDGEAESEGRIGRVNDIVRGLSIDPATCGGDKDD